VANWAALAFTNNLTSWTPGWLNRLWPRYFNWVHISQRPIGTHIPPATGRDGRNTQKRSRLSPPTLHDEAYNTLLTLFAKHSRTKLATIRGKKWWDAQVDEQMRATRAAGPEMYKKEAKALKKLIKQKKSEC